MRHYPCLIVFMAALSTSAAHAEKRVVCTAVKDAITGKMLLQEGACDQRVTSASTFKIAISLMGFDADFLEDTLRPELPFKEGYADWNQAWRQATNPSRWMKKSVVWYSQKITQSLGMNTFRNYVEVFDYGNKDVTGNPGKNDGLTMSWLSSSLQISPLEQLAFLGKIVRRELPVSDKAYDMTAQLVDLGVQPNGWHIYGKTGAGLPRRADGTLLRGQPFGWFVGWATKGDRTITFARLTHDTEKPAQSPGHAARDAVLRDLFSPQASW